MKQTKTRTLVECGLMVALAMVLSFIPIFEMPMGGSITLCSGVIQLLLGIKNVMVCKTIWAAIGCILLDYLIAFTVIGLSCVFSHGWKHRLLGIGVGTAIAGLIRYLCSFLSGILLWGQYAPEDMPVWLYSLTYNGSYMIPEIILTVIVVVLIMKKFPRGSLNQ
ncbi:MAG TPA: energy-coupled thiamine transporter ThiT [Firmicutes bacterium]|nr:energy-coupled thiamine transporter ThiT [Bacillota bacterium]